MQVLWERSDTEVIILADAGNGFNRLNRKRALRTTKLRCPSLFYGFQNLYGVSSVVHLGNGKQVVSREGTTQGCPFGVAMYSIASLPLIDDLERDDFEQHWYLDDSGGGGTVDASHGWFRALQEDGPGFGCCLRLDKCVALVKADHASSFEHTFSSEIEAGLVFKTIGIPDLDADEGADSARLLGSRCLGGGIGTSEYRDAWMRMLVEGWETDVRKLSAFGLTHPHHAYCLLVRNVIPQWRHSMRTTRCSPDVFAPLETALVSGFFPAVFGWRPDDPWLRNRCALPTRHGGLGIPNPVRMASEQYDASSRMTSLLVSAMQNPDLHYRTSVKEINHLRYQRRAARDLVLTTEADELAKHLTGRAAKAFEESRLRGGSSWLSFIPLDELRMGLDRQTFRDAIALRMGVPFPDPLPSHCPSCGLTFDVDHGLRCKKGGWVSRRHLEVIRAWKFYLTRGGYHSPREEPFLRPLPAGAAARAGTTRELDARADLLARGEGGRDWYFDIAIIDSFAARHAGLSSLKALTAYEQKKNKKYFDRVAPLGGFIPLVCTVYGTLGPAASQLAHRVAHGVDPDREESSAVVDLHSAVLQAAIIKATSLCLRGRSQTSLPIVDVASSFPEDAAGQLSLVRERDAAC
jgi:hypothetical protein